MGVWSLEGLGTGTQVPCWGGVRAARNPTQSPHEDGETLWTLQGQVPRPLPSSFLGAGRVHPMEAKVGSTQTQGRRNSRLPSAWCPGSECPASLSSLRKAPTLHPRALAFHWTALMVRADPVAP